LRLTETSITIRLNEGIVRGKDISSALIGSASRVSLVEGEEIVDTIVNYYDVDGKIIDEDIIGCKGENLTLNLSVIIGPSNELVKFKNIIKESGYKFKGFLANVVIGRNIFLQGKSSMGVKVLVDIGSGTTDIAIFSNGILKYLKCIPVGGYNITKDLSLCSDLKMVEAENVKTISSLNYQSLYNDNNADDIIQIGTSKISKRLFYEVTEARLEEILKFVNAEVKNTSYCEGLCSIIIYGNGIIYYENIQELVKVHIEKKAVVATSDYLGMKNTANITSLAGIKEIFERVQLLYSNPNKYELEENTFKETDNYDNERSKKRSIPSDNNDNGIVAKIKALIRGIF
jgi:cell division protein FtsA